MEEINYLVDKYHVNTIEIENDNFTINQKRVEEILNGIIEINKNKQYLSWQALKGLRIDTLNEDLIKVFKVVELLKKHEIDYRVFTVYGYPGETRERFDNAVNFYSGIKKLRPM